MSEFNNSREMDSDIDIHNAYSRDLKSLRVLPEDLIEVVGRTYSPNGNNGLLKRPNDTTAYTAWDAIGDNTTGSCILTFPNVFRIPGGVGQVLKATFNMDSATTTLGSFALLLYNAPPTITADNATFNTLLAQRNTYQGIIYFSVVTGGASSDYSWDIEYPNLPLVGGADMNLYGVLTAQAAYVPVANEQFETKLLISRY